VPVRPFLADDHSFGPRRHRKNVCGIVTKVIKAEAVIERQGTDVIGVRRAFGLHQKCELTTARSARGAAAGIIPMSTRMYAKSC
jgi:hypothetical protein